MARLHRWPANWKHNVPVRCVVLIPFLLVLSGCSGSSATASVDGGSPDARPDYDTHRVSVPFLVDDQFIPSGCIGDCASSVLNNNDCPERGSPDAQGECHHFVFTANTAAGAWGWASVLWQTTEQNWGSLPGRAVAPGATGMRFYAAGKAGGEALDIVVGGMIPTDAGKACEDANECSSGVCKAAACAEPHHDTLNVSKHVELSADYALFEIPFGSKDYGSEVMSGFGWTAKMPKNADKIEFFIDDLRWE